MPGGWSRRPSSLHLLVTMLEAQPSIGTRSHRSQGNRRDGKQQYRFGFVLSTVMGNGTRYLNLRKYAERDPEVDCVWAPITQYLPPDHPNLLKYLPRPLFLRAMALYEARPIWRQLAQLDAVMFHQFDNYAVACLRSALQPQPLVINSQDDPPIADPATYPINPHQAGKADWRRNLRFRFDCWCADRTACFIPFSQWAGNILIQDCHVPQTHVHPIHVGLDLDYYPDRPKPERQPGERVQLLFVGGDFRRKGGELLLSVYRQHFADQADLHLVTKTPPSDLLPQIHLYTDIQPNDPRLTDLYHRADIFVLPTLADLSPWVMLEAMAARCPVISTRLAGIPDLVRADETGLLVPTVTAANLTQALAQLIHNPDLRQQMGHKGRHLVEQEFNAAVNVPRILDVMKAAVDRCRHGQ